MIFQVSDCLKKLGLMCNIYLNRTLTYLTSILGTLHPNTSKASFLLLRKIMPFISSSYDGSSRRSSGSSVSSLRGLDRFGSTRKSSVYERPSTYTSPSNTSSSYTSPSNTSANYRSLERLKNGSSEDNSYLSSTTPSR